MSYEIKTLATETAVLVTPTNISENTNLAKMSRFPTKLANLHAQWILSQICML